MTEEPKTQNVEDAPIEDVEGHDAREATVLPQRPILFLDEAEDVGGDVG